MNLKIGDKVYYKDDLAKKEYQVYAIYSKNKVSLGLLDYPNTEQDYQTDIKDIKKV